VRVFKTRAFARFGARENIGDEALLEAADRASRRLVDADLGGGVVKQRIARPGELTGLSRCQFVVFEAAEEG